MQRYTLILTLLLASLLGACKRDIDNVQATPTADLNFTASANTLTLASAGPADTVLRLRWNPLQFGLSDGSGIAVLPVTYTLELAAAGNQFLNVTTIDAGVNTNRRGFTAGELNTLFTSGLGLAVGGPNAYEVRLRATYASNQSVVRSAVQSLAVTTYASQFYVYGNTLGALSATSPKLGEVAGSPSQYEGYVYLPAATNTIRFSNGTTYGGGGAAGSLVSPGADISLAGPRMYRLQVNLTARTYVATATTWGIIGAATTNSGAGWNQSVPMTYNTTTKLWTVTMPLPGNNGTAGGNADFKFRANNDWAINLGSNTSSALPLLYGGGNLTTPGPGTYTVSLDLNTPNNYTYSIR
ncbi:hypothetical protein FNT36_12365 [Hymenobacter setariae]|uniref:SusE outer membrane protein domain-containing protein n=1 Tax=Hymenobacter setariae TaxID=2594794 RepID=A0A558BUT2_9BACT|nr:SusE domain-containing protein [Hymenobacter setariae]TVT40270.1 hypothetical protein FNT36_12365 [Hymenobacter setariae]